MESHRSEALTGVEGGGSAQRAEGGGQERPTLEPRKGSGWPTSKSKSPSAVCALSTAYPIGKATAMSRSSTRG